MNSTDKWRWTLDSSSHSLAVQSFYHDSVVRRSFLEVSHVRTYVAAVVSILTLALICTAVAADPYTTEWWPEPAQDHVTNSWIGSTGVLNTPTAHVAGQMTVPSSIHWVETDPDPMTTVNINAGITENVELGVARLSDAFSTSRTETVGNVKYRVNIDRYLEAPKAPQLAIGAWDFTNELDRTYYVVITKDFPSPDGVNFENIRLSLGYGDNTEGVISVLDGAFAGIEVSAFENGIIRAEYDGENANYGIEY